MKPLMILIAVLCQSPEDARDYVETGQGETCVSIPRDPYEAYYRLVDVVEAIDTDNGIVYVGEVEHVAPTGRRGYSVGKLEMLLW